MRDLTAGDPVLILAGYPVQMKHFLSTNPGLSRRFQTRLSFPDYSVGELCQIFHKVVERSGFRLDSEISDEIIEAIVQDFPARVRNTWNGGLPEALFKKARDQLSMRLNVVTMDAELAFTITSVDVRLGAERLVQTMGIADHDTPSSSPSGSAEARAGAVRKQALNISEGASKGPASSNSAVGATQSSAAIENRLSRLERLAGLLGAPPAPPAVADQPD